MTLQYIEKQSHKKEAKGTYKLFAHCILLNIFLNYTNVFVSIICHALGIWL